MLNYLVIIPARSGSKRFPGKNLAFLGGIPLIVHSIRYALRFFPSEHVWVNTDADDIASVAKLHGANVFKRNETLATDLTSTSEVL